MPPTKICNKDVPECVMIDSTANPALDDARVAFPDHLNHSNIATVASALLEHLQAHPETTKVMIIGHGKPGAIATGSGAAISGKKKHIGSDNEGAWDSILKGLSNHNLTEIIFCSCNTGAKVFGSQLVFDIAKATGAKTSAYTGLITVFPTGDLDCQEGQWQEGDPNAAFRPPEINPTFSHVPGDGASLKLKHDDKGEYNMVSPKDVSSFSYYKNASQGKMVQICSQKSKDAKGFLDLIKFDDPFELEGELLAIVTGEIKLEYPVEGKHTRKRFTVYNDMVLRDKKHHKTFYHVSRDLRHALWDQVGS